MTSDKRSLYAANQATASPTPEIDSDEDKRKQLELATSSDGTTSQREGVDGVVRSVFVCHTPPGFCSVFQPRNNNRSQQLLASDCKTFTIHVPSFEVTCEGFVLYTVELSTCDERCHTFELERRFSEFVACAVEVNKQLASGFCVEKKNGTSEDDRDFVFVFQAFQWELPAKTWFRVTETSALEERRAQLERSLELLLLQHDRRICNLPVLRNFLMLESFELEVRFSRI